MTRIPGLGDNNPPPNALPLYVDSSELKFAHTIAAGLSTNFSIENAAAAALSHFTEADKANRRKRNEIRQALDRLHQIYAAYMIDPKEAETLKAACSRENIPIRRWDLALAVVRFHGRVTDSEKVNRYANVLREANLRKVTASTLAQYLEKPGQGIERLHKAYQRRANDDGLLEDAPITRGHRHSTVKRGTKKRLRRHEPTRNGQNHKAPRPIKEGAKKHQQRSLQLICKNLSKLEPYASAEAGRRLWIRVKKLDASNAEVREVELRPEKARPSSKEARGPRWAPR